MSEKPETTPALLREVEVKERIARMIGLLVDGSEQQHSYSALVARLFKSRAARSICGSDVATMLAELLDTPPQPASCERGGMTTLAAEIVETIKQDFTDRRGLRQEWENIDEDIQDEILEQWRSSILPLLSKPTPDAGESHEFTLLRVIADIRQKTGLNEKPMLSELADAIGDKIKRMDKATRILLKAGYDVAAEDCFFNAGECMSNAIEEALKLLEPVTFTRAVPDAGGIGDVERVARAIFNNERNSELEPDDLLTFDESRDSKDADERWVYERAMSNSKAAIAALTSSGGTVAGGESALANECASMLETYLDECHMEDTIGERQVIAAIRGKDFRHPIAKYWDNKTSPLPTTHHKQLEASGCLINSTSETALTYMDTRQARTVWPDEQKNALQRQIINITHDIEEAQKTNASLAERNEKLMKALEFYAYGTYNVAALIPGNTSSTDQGKVAREALGKD